MRYMPFVFVVGLICCATCATSMLADELEDIVRADRTRVEKQGFWLYNDLPGAYEMAKRTGKPILVSLRCIPCEECVKLDDDLIDNDPAIRELLQAFVCVRVVGTNGLDLNTFQYDTDQSFAMFMMNADKTIYGRFGTRSHRTEWLGDVSLEGMANALRRALELHGDYPKNQAALSAKTGKPLEFRSPEQYPSLNKNPDKLNYAGEVAKSCIHCHQIGEARRDFYWSRSQAIPERLMYPYPHPKSIGLILDPKECATVKEVIADSAASMSGLRPGDDILEMNNQPLISMADVQWVLDTLHSQGGALDCQVMRDGKVQTISIQLSDGWRRLDDTSWRTSSWIMRRAVGGMRLDALSDRERDELGISSAMALRASYLGQWGPYGTARRAGFEQDDILVKVNGRNDFSRESDLFDYINASLRPGAPLEVELLRDGKTLSKNLQVQK